LSIKLKVVIATGVGVDGCLGDDTAKNISACMPTSFVTGESGCTFTNTGWLLVKSGGTSYQKLEQ